MYRVILAAAVAISSATLTHAGDTPSNPESVAYVVNLENGATMQSPVTLVFGLAGMGVAPAGVEKEGTGHHHILLNRPPFGEGSEDAELIANGIPADDNHIHFGGGQTQTTLDLPPGEHTIQLVLGDHFHVPHNPPVVSEVMTITVTE
ncbi:DUF4399 domain-containing protein [Marivita sp. XM-24bin2]|jgi:hypothetical protein|uniref:DUF4399 domain-containing protein n=1 Tax=unclassified Marivita TaxID=2632480 RepID=UPI000D79BBAF|nr:DUF4399 domain-containing protein [Marivita sp. XM-24bin2]MCR9108435.1 DUF4399 domain-containing protein [Paracoccaceae bacterium]PWL34384.1 MAG: rod shape-determining protein RodA [Marivita sp. XM-24bin2]